MAAFKHLTLAMMLLMPNLSPAESPIWHLPHIAPAHYASSNYGITFHVPRLATYCPLPKDWVGSDHGTIIFLERPKRCGGAGYPSSSRNYEPDNLAAIDLYYGYWFDEGDAPASPCHQVATIIFLGTSRPVCEERKGRQITRTVTARYQADAPAQAVLTLRTRHNRLQSDMITFQKTAATVRSCKVAWIGPKGSVSAGHGLPCPKGSRWF
ncbi:hypothetical protein [Novosphingobium terrae]|uniref:hypothetical protein n=1 Tax=Novosphingobium terrae TaxID=2726189 RepID=UPI001981C2C2|nr:hypothetical protein [Novosphingobium terrae]